jgi:S1-C subfamily serine protease/predicted esterase
MRQSWFLLALASAGLIFGSAARAEDLDELQEKAIKSAVHKVAPHVVQIETSGGTDIISQGPRGGVIRKGAGATSGLIVGADGWIVTSAFNFANKPTDIIVSVPGQKERFVAKIIATDHSRSLTLLKIEAKGLPVPTATPKAEIKIGHSALALGRTLAGGVEQPPSVSVGIISAIGRIWGKALQTDAKVSPVNYGGPLVDLQGRVQGVLVPLSPGAEGETAGLEWYDSGIGFAIPLEDINNVLERLKLGKDLKKGLLGIQVQSPDIYGVPPTIGTILPDSPAARAGLKQGDVIIEIDGHPVNNQAQVLNQLGAHYEGDKVNVKVRRGKEEMTFSNVMLTGTVNAYKQAFLGILPMRDDPEASVEVRYVYPGSPADKAGIKAGDRIVKFGVGAAALQALTGGRDNLLTIVGAQPPTTEMKFEVLHKADNKTETVTVKLAEMPEDVPDKLPTPATLGKALEPRKAAGTPAPAKKDEEKKDEKKDDKKDEKKFETGLLKRTNDSKDHEYWVYVPKNYDPNISHSLVVWLHPVGKGKEKDFQDFTDGWSDFCEEDHIIMLCPKAENDTGWIPAEADFIQEAARKLLGQYTIDKRRVVAHGMGMGGQAALYMGFHNRDLIRAVAATGAVLNGQAKEKIAAQPLSFFIHVGGKDPLAKAVGETRTKVMEQKYPVVFIEAAEKGHQYLDAEAFDKMIRWIDSLDVI